VILLDTNIISEAMKPGGDRAVLLWLDDQALETLFLSTISLAELRFGIATLPAGRRKDRLGDELDGRILPLFEDRLLPFDKTAADAYGRLRAQARAAGRSIETADGYIAAIAVANRLSVATRDVGPFKAAGVDVIVP
jgi:hypothetical protein